MKKTFLSALILTSLISGAQGLDFLDNALCKVGAKDCESKEIKEMKSACDKGEAWQCHMLGQAYENGSDGAPKNQAKSEQAYKKFVDKYEKKCLSGDPGDEWEECEDVIRSYIYGKGVKPNYAKAKALAEKLGTPGANEALGILYEKGYGVKQDLEAAWSYYSRSSDGTPDATRARLVFAYQNFDPYRSQGVSITVADWRAACENPNAEACLLAGLSAIVGLGDAKQDKNLVKKYIQKAVSSACGETPEERTNCQETEYCKKSCEEANARAQKLLSGEREALREAFELGVDLWRLWDRYDALSASDTRSDKEKKARPDMANRSVQKIWGKR